MRKFKLSLALLLMIMLPPLVAVAATAYIKLEARLTPEQMHETGLDRLTPEQLARLNEVLAESEAARPAATTAPSTGAPGQGDHSFLGLSVEPIRSRVKGTVTGWEPGTVFELEDGQQWKVLKGSMKLHKPLEAPEVIVAPGLAGRWFLQVDEDLPKARVYRVD